MAEDKTGYTADLESFKRIGRVVREVETNMGLPPRTYRRARFIGPIVEGEMLTNIDSTRDPNAPTRGMFQIKSSLHGSVEWRDEPQPSKLNLWNRTTASARAGDVVFAQELYPDRWFLMPRGGGGGERIWFTIVSVECVSINEMILLVEPIWYTGGCEAEIPGADEYGFVVVEELCSILLHYTADWLDGTFDGTPKTGSATYMYPRHDYCEPKWILDDICGEVQCR